MQKILFPLNDTVVLFLHQDDTCTEMSHVVQITLRAERAERTDTIATYFLVRHEMSDLILRLVTAYKMGHAIPDNMSFENRRYTLHSHREEWPFGKRVLFEWGGEVLKACEDKWTFSFRVKPKQTAAEKRD